MATTKIYGVKYADGKVFLNSLSTGALGLESAREEVSWARAQWADGDGPSEFEGAHLVELEVDKDELDAGLRFASHYENDPGWRAVE